MCHNDFFIIHTLLELQEAEEQFTKRDKTLNYFSIMVNKRLKKDAEGEDAVEDGEESKGKTKKGKKAKVIQLHYLPIRSHSILNSVFHVEFVKVID